MDGTWLNRMRCTNMLSHRLYCKGRVLGHKRGKRNSRPNTSLIQIEGVANKEDAQIYLGKVGLCWPVFLSRIFMARNTSGLHMCTGQKRRCMGQRSG